MTPKIELFPVDNGDMTLITLASGKRILIDCNIRQDACDPDHDCYDALAALKKRLSKNADGRHYVDVFVLSHPDEDHCRGLNEFFVLGPSNNLDDDDKRIVINEIWSSPIIFRRFPSNDETLCSDADAFHDEAKRRVKIWRDNGEADDGNRILILGHDVDGKTETVSDIVTPIGDEITSLCGESEAGFSALLLGPLPPSDDEDEEEELSKNDSSVILNFTLRKSVNDDPTKFLTAGDAGVAIWERVNEKYDADQLSWDMLLAPHHCSWRALSHDSWSQSDNPEVSEDAKEALSHMVDDESAVVVASSKPIKDDDSDPPCIGAKREYVSWLDGDDDRFFCTGEHEVDGELDVLSFSISSEGLTLDKVRKAAPFVIGSRTVEHG